MLLNNYSPCPHHNHQSRVQPLLQVPTLRQHLGQYFTNTTARVQEEASLRYSPPHPTSPSPTRRIAYSSEIAAAVVGSSLGLLANLLLVWGVLKNRRWFLVHWLLLHLFLVVLLFLTSILVFVVQLGLWKLLGLVRIKLHSQLEYSARIHWNTLLEFTGILC